MVRGKEGVAFGEDAEDVSGKLDGAGTGGEVKNVEAGCGCGFEIPGDNAGAPELRYCFDLCTISIDYLAR